MSIEKIGKVNTLGATIDAKVTKVKVNEIIDAVNDINDGTTTLTEVEVGNGTVAAPSMSFTSDPDTGVYRIQANNIGIAANGAKVLDIATTGLGITGIATVSSTTASTTKDTGAVIIEGGVGIEKEIYAGLSINAGTYLTSGNGTVSLPAIGPVSDPDSGLYVIGANNLGMALAGAKVLDMRTTGLEVIGRTVKRPTATTVAANSGTTLTAAMMLSGYVMVTGTTGSLVFDSAANIVTALGTATEGLEFDFTLNTMGTTPMTAGNVLTLTTPGAGVVFRKQVNTTDVAALFIPTITATAGIHVGTFRVTFDTATTISVQRIG